MYCPKCGKQLAGDAKFCSGCGAPITPSSPPASGFSSGSSSTPLLTLRPVFIPSVTVLSVLPVQIFMTIWGAFFLGGFSMFGIKVLALQVPTWSPFVFWGAVFFLGIPLLTYWAKARTYALTEYRFFPSKLDYYEGFFTVEEKTIDYRHVTEVNLRKGIFQQKHGLGTIILSTPATGGRRARSGIRISDIENPDQVYHQVKDLVGRAR